MSVTHCEEGKGEEDVPMRRGGTEEAVITASIVHYTGKTVSYLRCLGESA